MRLKCVAIDDEPLALDLISQYIQRIPALQLIHTFDDAIGGSEFLRNNSVDLLLIDINMPDITGIELVRSLTNRPAVIFTTAYRQFALEGFELEAMDYLLKPISFERFSKAANRVIGYYEMKNGITQPVSEHFFVRSEYRMVKINMDDILYIEGLEDYIRIHLANEKPVLTLMTLKAILERLPVEKFKRIHRSFIIPVSRIRSVLNKKVTLDNNTELPISDSYISDVNEWIQQRR